MKPTRSYQEARMALDCAKYELSRNCTRMILHDVSPIVCATYVTDELEKFLIQYADDMTMTHRELFTLMCAADKAETKLYESLGVCKPTR